MSKRRDSFDDSAGGGVSSATREDLAFAVRRLGEAEKARAEAAVALARVRARGDGEAAVGMPVEQHLRWNTALRRGTVTTLGVLTDVAPELPTVMAALEAGTISFDQAAAVAWPAAKVSAQLRRSLDLSLATDGDGWTRLSPESLEVEVGRLLEELTPARTEQQELEAAQRQWLHLQPTLDGQGLSGNFQAWGPDAALINEAIHTASDAPAQDVPAPDGTIVRPTRRAGQLFDGLLRIFRSWTAGGGGTVPAVTLYALVDERDDATGTGEILTTRRGLAPRLSAAAVRTLEAAGARTIEVFTVERDIVAVKGRAGHAIDDPDALSEDTTRIICRIRDNTCRMPGCDRPASHLHHLIWRGLARARGQVAPDDPQHRAFLCEPCHRLVHRWRWAGTVWGARTDHLDPHRPRWPRDLLDHRATRPTAAPTTDPHRRPVRRPAPVLTAHSPDPAGRPARPTPLASGHAGRTRMPGGDKERCPGIPDRVGDRAEWFGTVWATPGHALEPDLAGCARTERERQPVADDPAKACFALLERACDAYGRDDLAERLEQVRERWERPHLRLLVVGSFKQGKSTLVNALLGKEICPTDDHVATALPLIIRHGPEDRATEITRDDEGELQVREIAVDAVPAIVVGADDRGDEPRPVAVERITPSRLLERGLEIVDTPGTGGLDSRHATATRATFPTADAILFVTDATQELTGPELGVLTEAVQQAGAAALVVTKADMSPAWRRLVDLDRGHLDVAGIAVPVFPVSATVRQAALSARSREVNVESGFADVARWLSELAATGDALADAVALREVDALIDHLLEPHAAARDAATDPDAAARLVEELQAAEGRAEQLRSAGRWQQLLSDGVSDLNAEVDHDFRERMRQVTRDAEAMLDDADPADCWDDFEPWLYVRVSDEVVANTALLNEQATLLATRLEEQFGLEAGEHTASLALSAPVETLGSLDGISNTEPRKVGRTQTGLTAARGMQGGVMMFGMLGNLIGLTIAGPAVIGVGLVMGAKSVRDERKRQVTVRRQQAKQATRRYLDEVQFQVGKDNRAAMRQTQRLLRDHFAARAGEAQRSVADALAAARQAVASDEKRRSRQLADATAEIERLDALRRQCHTGLGPEARAEHTPLDDEVAV